LPKADLSRIGTAGDSAGGNLATVVTLLSITNGGPKISSQVLIYPNVDMTVQSFERKSWCDFQDIFLTKQAMQRYIDWYINPTDNRKDPRMSPIWADKNDLAKMPPTLVITAEIDILRDEGEEYAKLLHSVGVNVELIRYNGYIHGFYSLFKDLSQPAIEQTAQFLIKCWQK